LEWWRKDENEKKCKNKKFIISCNVNHRADIGVKGNSLITYAAADMGGDLCILTAEESETDYVSAESVITTGWQTDSDGNTYYYDENGEKTTGKVVIGDATYYFNLDGIMQTGLQPVESSTYYFSTETDTLGQMVTGWKTIDGSKYYFSTNADTLGQMATGWQTISKSKYYFGTNGKMVTGWKTISSSKYYFGTNGKMVTGWKTISKSKYYFASNGKMVTGYKKIGSYKYYFSSKGVLQKSKIVGTKKLGYNYVDSAGRVVTSKEIKYAVNFVKAHTKDSWSKSKKLKTCYNYLWKNYPYKRYYDKASAKKMSTYAQQMFKNKKGNCYRYAASFACIARVIGYDSRVVNGGLRYRSGGWSYHGWTEVKVNGKWYICDANMQRNYPKVNAYMRTESNYPYTHIIRAKYKLTISKGKAVWK